MWPHPPPTLPQNSRSFRRRHSADHGYHFILIDPQALDRKPLLASHATRYSSGEPLRSEPPPPPMANLFEPSRYIAVEGPIRLGKSTLANFLAMRLHGQLILEGEQNPFLSAFYDGDSGAAFQAQLTFLVGRYEQL